MKYKEMGARVFFSTNKNDYMGEIINGEL